MPPRSWPRPRPRRPRASPPKRRREDSSHMARLDSFLRLVVEQHASDLHFHAGVSPIIRHDGDLVSLNFRVLTESDARKFLLEILTPQQRERFETEQEIDFIYELEGVGRFR